MYCASLPYFFFILMITQLMMDNLSSQSIGPSLSAFTSHSSFNASNELTSSSNHNNLNHLSTHSSLNWSVDCSYMFEEVTCDCDLAEQSFKCLNVETSEDLLFALAHLLNVTKRYYWSLLEVNCIQPFSTNLKSFHITTDLFSTSETSLVKNIPKFRQLRLIGDCSKPKHYDNLLTVDKDIEIMLMVRNTLRLTTSCSLLQPKLERLLEMTLKDSIFAGDMISATFSSRCLGQYGTRNEPLPLTKLIIKSCNITLIESDAFINFPELELIDLSQNQLTHLSRQSFAPKLYKVRFLHLQFNRLNELSPDFFADLPQLRVVNLVGNQLKSLPFIPPSALIPQVILLEGNPWDCRCKMAWIVIEKTAINEANGRYNDGPVCATPEMVKGKSIIDGLRYVYTTFC